jgi:hypothetical protein
MAHTNALSSDILAQFGHAPDFYNADYRPNETAHIPSMFLAPGERYQLARSETAYTGTSAAAAAVSPAPKVTDNPQSMMVMQCCHYLKVMIAILLVLLIFVGAGILLLLRR